MCGAVPSRMRGEQAEEWSESAQAINTTAAGVGNRRKNDLRSPEDGKFRMRTRISSWDCSMSTDPSDTLSPGVSPWYFKAWGEGSWSSWSLGLCLRYAFKGRGGREGFDGDISTMCENALMGGLRSFLRGPCSPLAQPRGASRRPLLDPFGVLRLVDG